MAYTLTKAERETVISFDEESGNAILYTASQIMMRRMDKLCETAPENYKELVNRRTFVDGDCISKMYSFPKRLLSFRTGKSAMTEEQKEAARERGRKLRAEQLAKINSTSKMREARPEETS